MRQKMAALIVVLAAALLAWPSAYAQSSPTCSLSAPGDGHIYDTLAGLKSSGGTYFWYIATLDGPQGQQIYYFRPQSSFVAVFAYQGAGSYVGGLETTVDNNKGPAKYTKLPTSCDITG